MPATAKKPAEAKARMESREASRHPCAVETTCQPPSAWTKDPWPCVIRDISTGGLSLTLARRFEKGSGLAIELPGDDGFSTVLARVVHVRSHEEGGWLLGVDFISELGDGEVEQVLQLSSLKQASPEGAGPALLVGACVTSVLFQARLPSGGLLRWYVKRLDFPGAWPLARGKNLSLRLPGGSAPLPLTIRKCRQLGSYWIVDSKLGAPPPRDVLDILSGPAISRLGR